MLRIYLNTILSGTNWGQEQWHSQMYGRNSDHPAVGGPPRQQLTAGSFGIQKVNPFLQKKSAFFRRSPFRGVD